MFFRLPFAAAATILVSSVLIASVPAVAAPGEDTSAGVAERGTTAPVRLAQKADENEKKRKGDGANGGKNGGPPGNKARGEKPRRDKGPNKQVDQKGPPPQKKDLNKRPAKTQDKVVAPDKAQQAKDRKDFQRQKQLEAQQNRQKAFEKKQLQKQQRQDAAKQKQLQQQKARDEAKQQQEKARQEKLRQRAIEEKKVQDAMRPDNFRQKQLEEKQAKDKARQDALRQKQLEEKQFKDKARDRTPPPLDRDRVRKDPRDEPRVGKGRDGFDRGKADKEFEKARDRARQDRNKGGKDAERWRDGSASKFEAFRRGRKERDVGSRRIIEEPDKRVIVRGRNRNFIRHDETRRFKKIGRELKRERRKNNTLMIVTAGLAGALIYTLQDDHGRVLRRSRRGRDGREMVLFDNRSYYSSSNYGPDDYYDDYVELPPPSIGIPQDEYIVDYDDASEEDIYEALSAPPVEPLDRGYSLDQVRRSYSVLERMRRVDLDAITFEFGSWEVGPDQYPKLERIADAMRRILDRSPGEMFMIEGHTDAVGADIDNLSLSDRRAESVAIILSEEFDVAPENLTTQGYGEQYLKELTDGPSRINRRVSLRRITPLLSRKGWDDNVE